MTLWCEQKGVDEEFMNEEQFEEIVVSEHGSMDQEGEPREAHLKIGGSSSRGLKTDSTKTRRISPLSQSKVIVHWAMTYLIPVGGMCAVGLALLES